MAAHDGKVEYTTATCKADSCHVYTCTRVLVKLTRPQSSSYNTRQRKSCARGRGAGDATLPFSVPISPCALLARCMKTTGDESACKESLLLALQ